MPKYQNHFDKKVGIFNLLGLPARFQNIFGTLSHWLVGQRLDVKSNLCPISVQTLSGVCPISGKVQSLSNQVQGLSKACRVPVQFRGSWTVIGHGHPVFIQTLSKIKSSKTRFSDFGHSMDKDWTWTDSGESLDLMVRHE